MKPGDKVVIKTKYGCDLYKVDRITPTGRIVCGGYIFNPDLTLRGKSVLEVKAWVGDQEGIRRMLEVNELLNKTMRAKL